MLLPPLAKAERTPIFPRALKLIPAEADCVLFLFNCLCLSNSAAFSLLIFGLVGLAILGVPKALFTSPNGILEGSAKFGTKPPAAFNFLAPLGRPIDLTILRLNIASPPPE